MEEEELKTWVALNEAWFVAKDRGQRWEEGWLVPLPCVLGYRAWLLLSISTLLVPSLSEPDKPPPVACFLEN